MDDLINKQEVVDLLMERASLLYGIYGDLGGACSGAAKLITQMPSAQPEIVRCKDCKHFIREDIEEYTPYGFYNTYFHAFCDKHWDREQGEYIDVKLDDFCSFAERRKK